jgi:hypothetical protein
MINFQSGDVFLVHEKGLNWAQLITRSRWCHAGIIDEVSDGDFGILESITSKGVSCGLLSFYKGKELAIYRYKGITPEQQQDIRHQARKRGRLHYDIFLPLRIIKRIGLIKVIGVLWNLWFGDGKVNVPHQSDNYVVCSELVQEAYSSSGIPLCPDTQLLLPKDVINDKMELMWSGVV